MKKKPILGLSPGCKAGVVFPESLVEASSVPESLALTVSILLFCAFLYHWAMICALFNCIISRIF